MSLHMVWRPQNSWCLQKICNPYLAQAIWSFAIYGIMRELENRAQEPSYGNISLLKNAQNDLICYTGCQETPSGTSNHRHRSWSPKIFHLNSWLGSKASCSLVCFRILIWRLLCSPQIQLYFSYYVLPLLVRPENSPPPPLLVISQDTRDFIQVSNSQQSPRTVEKGTSS